MPILFPDLMGVLSIGRARCAQYAEVQIIQDILRVRSPLMVFGAKDKIIDCLRINCRIAKIAERSLCRLPLVVVRLGCVNNVVEPDGGDKFPRRRDVWHV